MAIHTIKEYSNSFGGRVRQYREARGITQIDLAKKCKVISLTIKKIEDGSTHPMLFTAAEIAKALNVDLHLLVFGNSHGINAATCGETTHAT